MIGCGKNGCGKWRNGEVQLCEKCRAKYEKQYPQGWHAYPGDTCKHGVHVGGMGADRMCPRCESGD